MSVTAAEVADRRCIVCGDALDPCHPKRRLCVACRLVSRRECARQQYHRSRGRSEAASRRCLWCKKDRPATEFSSKQARQCGRCKEDSIRRSGKKWSQANKKYYRDKGREYYREHRTERRLAARKRYADQKGSVVHVLRRRLQSSAGRARKIGVQWALSLDVLVEIYEAQDGRCAVSGRLLEFTKDQSNPNVLSLDRIDRYTKENVRLVTLMANGAMREWGYDALASFCRDVVRQSAKKTTTQKKGSSQCPSN